MTTPSASTPVRIAIIEDEPAVRRYFMQIMGMAEGHDVIAMAPDLATGRGLIGLAPDLFLMDIGLPDGNGYDLVPEIKAACGAKVLIISSFGDRDTVVKALSARADGYLLQDPLLDHRRNRGRDSQALRRSSRHHQGRPLRVGSRQGIRRSPERFWEDRR